MYGNQITLKKKLTLKLNIMKTFINTYFGQVIFRTAILATIILWAAGADMR